LEDRNLLDDQAFSHALVRDRIRFSPRSPASLRHELIRRGIAGETAASAVDRVLEEDGLCEHRLAQEAGRRWAARQGRDALTRLTRKERGAERNRARRRLYGFLARKGFRGEAVRAGMEAAWIEARNLLSNNQ
jgi:regulatory protein